MTYMNNEYLPPVAYPKMQCIVSKHDLWLNEVNRFLKK